MRDYIFHGKRIDTDEWVEGYYCKVEKLDKSGYEHFIIEESADGSSHLIEPESVGQYTGMNDKNGRKIFEGDIVDCWSDGVHAKGTVQQRKDGLWIIYPAWQKYIMWGLCPDEYSNTTVEVIGNEFENKDLLEEWAWII